MSKLRFSAELKIRGLRMDVALPVAQQRRKAVYQTPPGHKHG